MQLKRPILVGGLGLSASLWLLNVVGHSPVGHALGDGSLLMTTLVFGAGAWWLNQRKGAAVVAEPPLAVGPVDKATVEAALDGASTVLETLIAELKDAGKAASQQAMASQISEQQAAIAQAREGLTRDTLTLALVGNKAVGKSAVLSHLQAHWQPAHPAVTGLGEVQGEESLPPAEADLVLFVAAADVTQSELQRIQSLLKAGYRVQVVFNKQDQLTPLDRQSVVQRIQTRVEAFNIPVSAIAAQPNPIKVRRHQENGEIEESFEQPAPELDALTTRLSHAVENEAEQLVLTTSLRQAKALKATSQQLLNQHRRQRAMPIVEQMQWVAAGTAFASPLPSLDLLASTAINGQLIVDLGAVYGQTFSLEQAKTAAATLAELLVKLGLVELSTQALGSLLKTHAATYAVGGVLQGVSAAYLTRMVGLSLIEFFEEQSLLPQEKQQFSFAEMGGKLQAIFKVTKQGKGLQTFVQQALAKLPALPASEPRAGAPSGPVPAQ